MIKLDVTTEEFQYIRQIADRAFSAQIYSDDYGDTMHDAMMDVQAVHCNGCPLDLVSLARADALHFAHDLAGIRKYLNRNTGQLMEHFTPRFAKNQ